MSLLRNLPNGSVIKNEKEIYEDGEKLIAVEWEYNGSLNRTTFKPGLKFNAERLHRKENEEKIKKTIKEDENNGYINDVSKFLPKNYTL